MNKFKFLSILGLALLIMGCGAKAEPKATMTVYKSATCGCCSGWANHMESNGYEIKVVNLGNDDLSAIKHKFGISRSVMSCHTAVVGDYFVEGHIPSKVVDQLLAEKPPINGIAMAGMPAGTPGMPGPKNDVWKIHAMKDGEISAYLEL
jgi:hypothetical protein